MHGHTVTTHDGTETTVCPDVAATNTEIPSQAIPEPSCYPTHGPPHVDKDRDELIRLCWADKDEFDPICKSNNAIGASGTPISCPNGSKGLDRPTYNNHYDVRFVPADGAPDDCEYIFGRSPDEYAGVQLAVDALCIPAFQAIRNKCFWNGGEVSTECGTFMYQSCPKDKECEWGSPAG